MEIRKFLRNIFSSEEQVKEKEKINLNQLESWITQNKLELEKKEREVSESIKFRIKSLISELESHIPILEKVDISAKKAEEKIKLVVRENLSLYVRYLNKLIGNLKGIEEKPLDRLDIIFDDFSKKSEITYQKATFLIGKELGQVKEIISQFSKDIKDIVNQNAETFNKIKIIKEIENKHKEKVNLEESKSKLKSQQEQNNLKIEDKKSAVIILTAEIEQIKKSKGYLEMQEKHNEHRKAKEDLIKEAYKLREQIDFKHLAGIFHINEKKMKIIKEYNEHFLQMLETDNGKSLLNLLIEANYSKDIQNKLSDLITKQNEIQIFQQKDETIELESEIKKIKHEIAIMEEENSKLEKAKDKLKENEISLINEIKLELIKINTELELQA